MKKQELLDKLVAKAEEARVAIEGYKNRIGPDGQPVEKGTAQVQKQVQSTKLKACIAFMELINQVQSDDIALTKDSEAFLNSYTTLRDGNRGVVQVQEGDSIISLLKKYPNVKNILEKADKSAAKAGLVRNLKGVYVASKAEK